MHLVGIYIVDRCYVSNFIGNDIWIWTSVTNSLRHVYKQSDSDSNWISFSFMFFAPSILMYLHNTTEWNAQFSKLIFNFCCLLRVSNLVGSSSGRQLYMQYGTFYMQQCEQSGRTHSTIRQTAHTNACKTYHSVYTLCLFACDKMLTCLLCL